MNVVVQRVVWGFHWLPWVLLFHSQIWVVFGRACDRLASRIHRSPGFVCLTSLWFVGDHVQTRLSFSARFANLCLRHLPKNLGGQTCPHPPSPAHANRQSFFP